MQKIGSFFGKPNFKFNTKEANTKSVEYHKCNLNGSDPLIIDTEESTQWSYSAIYQFNSITPLTQLFNYGEGLTLLIRAGRDAIWYDKVCIFEGELISNSEINIPIEIKILYKNNNLSFYKNGNKIWNKDLLLTPSKFIYIGRTRHHTIEGMDGFVKNVTYEYGQTQSTTNKLMDRDIQLMENQKLIFNQMNIMNETLLSKNKRLEMEIMELKAMNSKLMDLLQKQVIETTAYIIEPFINDEETV